MAIAYDVSSTKSGSTDLSWTHTPVGVPRGVVVIVNSLVAAGAITSVKYGGVTMTQVTGSPITQATLTSRAAAYHLGSGIPRGPQTVVVDFAAPSGVSLAVCYTVTADMDTGVQITDTSINTDSVSDPSATLALGGVNCWVVESAISGQDAVAGITPLAGWTSTYEYDYGTSTFGWYRYDTIGTSNVTIGWTQTTDAAACLALAITEIALKSDATIITTAPAYDTFSRCTEGTDDLSWTHTPVANAPKGVVVYVVAPEGTDHVVSATYGGVNMPQVALSPNLKAAAEAGSVHCFFLGSGIPTGAQTVAVDTDGSLAAKRMGMCITVTAATDTLCLNTATISSNAVQNPSATIVLRGETCFVSEAFFSGQDATTGIAALAGWTAHRNFDFGTSVGSDGTCNTVGATNVTFGWTQTSEDAVCIATAIAQLTLTKTIASDATITRVFDCTVSLSLGIQKLTGPGVWTTITTTSGSLVLHDAGTYSREYTLVLNNPSLNWTSGSQYRAIVVSTTDAGLGSAITAKNVQITGVSVK